MTTPVADPPLTDLDLPLGVRALMGGGALPEAVADAMVGRLPPGGVSAPRLRDRLALAGATWRLLDSRVLAAAVDLLDADVATPLVTWLGGYERVAAAAATTLSDVGRPEITEVVLPSRPFTHRRGLAVDLLVDEQWMAGVQFRLDVTAALGETSVVVRLGAIPEVVVDVLTVTAALFLVEWPTPLWSPLPASVPRAHLRMQPPVRVPLLPVPRPGQHLNV